MWQEQTKDNAIVNLVLSLALATTPMAATFYVSTPVLAQSATDTPSFSLPQTVESGSTVRVDGSSTLGLINQNLKAGFEKQFGGTKVEIANNGTDEAIKALLAGNIDVAAIGRGLTPEEKAQGLEQVRLHREKIAIIVGEENPFKGSLTDRQFARIFRGRITEWSQLKGVEGAAGKIRVIDRPTTSDTRTALNNYPVFKAAKFATGNTATQLTEDSTAEIAKQLGKDGISYARVNQVLKLSGVRVLRLHETLPTDPKYPFSQPLVYVFKKNPNPAVAGFLGFALATPGKQAIETARIAEASAIANGESPNLLLAVNPKSNSETITAAATPPASSAFITTAPTATTAPSTTSGKEQSLPASNPTGTGSIALWLLVLPLAVVAGLLLWMIRTSPPNGEAAEEIPPANPQPLTTTVSESVRENVADNWTNGDVSHNGAKILEGTNAATITDLGLGVGAGAVIGSMIVGQAAQNHQTQEHDYDLDISPWDMEVPAAVVNTAYPAILDRSKTTVAQTESITVNSDQPEVTAATVAEIIPENVTPTEKDVTLELPKIPEDSEDDWGFELSEDVTVEDSQLDPEIEKLNVVADAAEPDLEDTEELILNNSEGLMGAGMGAWSSIEPVQLVGQVPSSTATASLAIADGESKVVLTPSSHDVADVSWEISETGQQILQNAGISQLALRIYDVTNIDMSYQQPQLVQQYECELSTSGGSVAIPQTDRDYIAAIGHGTEGDRWVTIAHSPIARVFGIPHTNSKVANVVLVDETSTVAITARTHQLADVSWEISETTKQLLRNAGVFELALRLYNVTNIDMSYQQPELLQQYEFDLGASDSSVAIPTPDHDYIAEIGYLIVGDRWVSIARSPIVRVFAPLYTESENGSHPDNTSLHFLEDNSRITLIPRTPKWAYASWEISETRKQMLQNAGIFQLALRLYDATDLDMSYQPPQFIQQYECEEITHDRYVAIPVSDRDYMLELGYVSEGDSWVTITRSASVRVFSRPQRDFWFVADAELIIHGATEPNATVNIAGNTINLKPDGTFHLRVPFSENLIDYIMTAIAADGEQSRTIHKKFSQEIPEA